MQITIEYGNSNVGYGRAIVAIGKRGGLSVTSHDGDARRVTRAALIQAAHEWIGGDPHPSIVTTASDYIAATIK